MPSTITIRKMASTSGVRMGAPHISAAPAAMAASTTRLLRVIGEEWCRAFTAFLGEKRRPRWTTRIEAERPRPRALTV